MRINAFDKVLKSPGTGEKRQLCHGIDPLLSSDDIVTPIRHNLDLLNKVRQMRFDRGSYRAEDRELTTEPDKLDTSPSLLPSDFASIKKHISHKTSA